MEKILVLRGGALGDFIVTLPALRGLRERWPRAQVELAGNSTAAQLALARGWIDRVHSQHEARWAALYGDGALSAALAEWLADFDLVLSYWPDPDGALARRFPLRANQQFVTAPAMPMRAPAAAHYCVPLRKFRIEPRDYFVRLAPLGRERMLRVAEDRISQLAHARSYERERVERVECGNCIAIHPGSGSPRKNWPADNWRRLIDELSGPVSLILGEAESPQWSAWAERLLEDGGGNSEQRLGVKPLHLFLNRPLEELVDHFARCRMFLGHDAGISHLAAACGARCVLLFGPTEPEVWAPPVPNVRVVRCHSDLAALPVDAVRCAVEEALADQK
jgi:heptosyltransferase-2